MAGGAAVVAGLADVDGGVEEHGGRAGAQSSGVDNLKRGRDAGGAGRAIDAGVA